MKSPIGERVRQVRKMKGLTQKALADTVGLTQQALSKIEKGDTTDSQALDNIAKALGVHPVFLRYGPEGLRYLENGILDLARRISSLSEKDKDALEHLLATMERATPEAPPKPEH